MNIEYKFSILRIEVTSIESLGDAVRRIFWRCTGTNGNFSAYYDCSCPFSLKNVDPNNFIPLKDLTDDAMIDRWVLPRLDSINGLRNKIENSIEQQLRAQFLSNQ